MAVSARTLLGVLLITLLQWQGTACAAVGVGNAIDTTTPTTTLSAEEEKDSFIVDLYNCSRTDGLYCLNNDDFRQQVLMKPYVWLVEFYNSWCGHCQLYAPTWVKFALRVKDWSEVVRIGAINCARSTNVPVCRDYEVGAYPWVKLFPAQSQPDTQGFYLRHMDVKKMTALAVDELTRLQQSDHPPTWPSLSISNESVSELKRRPAQLHVVVLEESADSQLGRQLILDLSRWRSSLLIRRYLTPPVDMAREYTEQPRPLVVVYGNDGPTLLRHASEAVDIVQQLEYYRRRLLDMAGIATTPRLVTEQPTPSQHQPPLLATPPSADLGRVSPGDLEKAVHYAVTNEVLSRRQFGPEALPALTAFLRLLQQHLPGQRVQLVTALEQLFGLLEQAGPSAGGAWLQERMERDGVVLPGAGAQWGHCRGSEPQYRGYTCSLWMLFHTVTVNQALTEPNSSSSLPVILGYVKHFFSCRECSENFQKMADEDGLSAVDTASNAALWLWRAHNKVNKRLRNTLTQDPLYPKLQFPSEQQCAECRSASGEFDGAHVLDFLQHFYHVPSPRFGVVEAPLNGLLQQQKLDVEQSVPVSHHTVAIDSADVSLCVLLWVFGAITLLVAWQLTRLRRKRNRRANLSWKLID